MTTQSVQEPSDDGNASERASQPVETADSAPTRGRSFAKDVWTALTQPPEAPASGRPNAGQATAADCFCAGPFNPDGGDWYAAFWREHDRAHAVELERNAAEQRAASWWEAAKGWCRVALTLQRIIHDLESEAAFRDPSDVVGEYSERSVDDIVGARVLREYADRLRKHPVLAEPVTDREEPALTADPQPVSGEFLERLASTTSREEPDLSAWNDEASEIAEQSLPAFNEALATIEASEKPGWDVEADTHRISEDHEEPACDSVCRNLGCAGDCRTASEEPAGETKPRTLHGQSVPDHIEINDEHSLIKLTCNYGESDQLSHDSPETETFFPAHSRNIRAFLRTHAHGRPVERQADSEARR